MKNYYDILNVSETASQDEIKKAYRQLSKQYHPDVNPNGEEKFKEVSEAYDNIGDENKRKEYDGRRNNPFGGMGNGFDFGSAFEEMMRGGRRQQRPVAPDKVINTPLTPLESFKGVKKEIRYEYLDSCNTCDSTGGDRKVCNTCKGQGFVTQKMGTGMFQQIYQSTCPTCAGKGSVISNPCNSCNGLGLTKKSETLSVTIPKNVDNGDFMRVAGKGDFNPNVRMRGDLILKVILNKSGDFEKVGMDLVYSLKLNVLSLLSNKQILIPHPDGDLMVNLPNPMNSDKPLRLVKKGYRNESGSGDFYIKISVTNEHNLPKDVEEKIQELIKEFC
jgi:molecular chaperone DnaJ